MRRKESKAGIESDLEECSLRTWLAKISSLCSIHTVVKLTGVIAWFWLIKENKELKNGQFKKNTTPFQGFLPLVLPKVPYGLLCFVSSFLMGDPFLSLVPFKIFHGCLRIKIWILSWFLMVLVLLQVLISYSLLSWVFLKYPCWSLTFEPVLSQGSLWITSFWV